MEDKSEGGTQLPPQTTLVNLMPSCNFITNDEQVKIHAPLNHSPLDSTTTNSINGSLNVSFSIYFLELQDSDNFNILKKGDLFIKLSKYKSNKLVINNVTVNYDFNLFKWYHVYLTFSNQELKVKITKYNEIVHEEEIFLEINLKSMINEYNPFIIPPKIENSKPFKGIFKNLYAHFGNFEILKFDYNFPSMEISNEPFNLISQPIYSVDQFSNFDYSDHFNISRISLNGNKSTNNQKLILCHDMQGGYLGDKFIQGGNSFLSYNFNFWQYVDIFIYFSHYRITIPPVGWIEVAHKNGVTVLGNFIVEWDEGSVEISKILNGNYKQFADDLINLAIYYKLDGWFLNIECKLENDEMCNKMIDFLKYLTIKCHEKIENSKVIWYDSITFPNGELKWQNELNGNNFIFYNSCDGIFLNYGWKPEMLQNSINYSTTNSENNPKIEVDTIYTGIDIFGRGQYGGGQFNTKIALKEINKVKTSIGLFAPGFVYENHVINNINNNISKNVNQDISNLNIIRNEYENYENLFWNGNEHLELLINGNGKLNEFEGWNINGNWIKTSNNEFGDSKSFVSSFDWCKMSQTIDLNTFKNINYEKPLIINGKCWIKGTGPNYSDLFYLNVKLLNDHDTIIKEYHSGEIIASNQWKCIQFKFIEYLNNDIYSNNNNTENRSEKQCNYKIVWEHGAKDVEFWAGNYGTRVSNCSLLLRNHERIESISNHVCERSINHLFSTNFNTGVGQGYFIYGNKISTQDWNDISEQDLLPTFRNCKINSQLLNQHISSDGRLAQEYAIDWNFDYSDSFMGASCLLFEGKFNWKVNDEFNERFTRFKLFKTGIEMKNQPSPPLCIQYAYKKIRMDDHSHIRLVIETEKLGSLIIHKQNETKKNHSIEWISSETINNEWILDTFKLFIENDVIVGINVDCFQSDTPPLSSSLVDEGYSIKLGYLNVSEHGLNLELQSIDEIQVNRSFNVATCEESELLCDFNLKWTNPINDTTINGNNHTRQYLIYKENDQDPQNGELIGRTTRTFYRLNKQPYNTKIRIKYY